MGKRFWLQCATLDCRYLRARRTTAEADLARAWQTVEQYLRFSPMVNNTSIRNWRSPLRAEDMPQTPQRFCGSKRLGAEAMHAAMAAASATAEAPAPVDVRV